MKILDQINKIRQQEEFRFFNTSEILDIIQISLLQQVLEQGATAPSNKENNELLRLNLEYAMWDLDLKPLKIGDTIPPIPSPEPPPGEPQ